MNQQRSNNIFTRLADMARSVDEELQVYSNCRHCGQARHGWAAIWCPVVHCTECKRWTPYRMLLQPPQTPGSVFYHARVWSINIALLRLFLTFNQIPALPVFQFNHRGVGIARIGWWQLRPQVRETTAAASQFDRRWWMRKTALACLAILIMCLAAHEAAAAHATGVSLAAVTYCRSTDGNDADDGSTWALADATLAASLVASGAGGTSYVSQAHAESAAGAKTLAGAGTSSSMQYVLCANDAAQPPTALATTATVTTTGANALNMSTGFDVFYGITFNCATGSTATSSTINTASNVACNHLLDHCAWQLKGTNTGNRLQIGVTGANSPADRLVTFDQTTVQFAAAAQSINLRGTKFVWKNSTGFTGGTTPTELVELQVNSACDWESIGCDFSGVTNTLFATAGGGAGWFNILMRDCKIATGVTIGGLGNGPGGSQVTFLNVLPDYPFMWKVFAGTESYSSTVYRAGGATDGSTPISHKIVTTANASRIAPFKTLAVEYVAFSSAEQSVSVPIINDGTTLKNDEVWLELETITATNRGGFADDRAAADAYWISGGANQATDSTSTWTDGGMSSAVKQTADASITPLAAGQIIRGWLCVAKPSLTMYFDPKFLPGSPRQWQMSSGYMNEQLRVAPGLGIGLM